MGPSETEYSDSRDDGISLPSRVVVRTHVVGGTVFAVSLDGRAVDFSASTMLQKWSVAVVGKEMCFVVGSRVVTCSTSCSSLQQSDAVVTGPS